MNNKWEYKYFNLENGLHIQLMIIALHFFISWFSKLKIKNIILRLCEKNRELKRKIKKLKQEKSEIKAKIKNYRDKEHQFNQLFEESNKILLINKFK